MRKFNLNAKLEVEQKREFSYTPLSECESFSTWLSHSWPLFWLGGSRGWRFFGLTYDVKPPGSQSPVPAGNSRKFKNDPEVTHFERHLEGGVILATHPKEKGSKWQFEVSMNNKSLGKGQFKRIRDGEQWARGLLRRERRQNKEVTAAEEIK